jgi:predicted dehydrogenase
MAQIGASTDSINIAIIGLGNIGARYDMSNPNLNLTHASAISSDKRFNLVGGIDQNAVFRKDFEKVYRVPSFKSIRELFNVVAPNAIVVSTRTESHMENLMELGKFPNVNFILCEKPIARETEGLGDVLLDAAANGQKIMVNYQRRTEHASKEIRNLISRKEFGCFVGGSGHYSGGYFNNGSHMLDLLEWWLGAEFRALSLVEASSYFDDYRVSFVSKISDANFYLNSMNSATTSFFEIYLQFEFCQLRYCSGGSSVFIDRIVKDLDYPDFNSIQTSVDAEYSESKQTLSSVYEDIHTGMFGGNMNLPTASNALHLMEKMKSVIHKNGESSC